MNQEFMMAAFHLRADFSNWICKEVWWIIEENED